MDEAALQAEKNKRIKGLAFLLLFLLQMPILVMWLTGYRGYLFPFWVVLMWVLIAYWRAKTTSYVIRIGAYGLIDSSNREIMAHQERPWYFLLPIPIWGGLAGVLRIAEEPGASRWMIMASGVCGALIALTCLLEAARKWRL